VKNKIQERQGCQCECMDVSERANKLVDNIVCIRCNGTEKKILNSKSMEKKKTVFG